MRQIENDGVARNENETRNTKTKHENENENETKHVDDGDGAVGLRGLVLADGGGGERPARPPCAGRGARIITVLTPIARGLVSLLSSSRGGTCRTSSSS